MIADAIRTGLSMAAANVGFLARTSIPMPVGTRISANTLTTSSSGIDTDSLLSK